MNLKSILKLVVGPLCIALGLYLAIIGYRSKDTTGQKIKHEFTGSYSDHVKRNMIGGIVLVVIGGALVYFVRGSKR